MALPLIAAVGKLLGGKKILSGVGKLVGGLLKKKAGGSIAGNALRGLGGVPGLVSLGSSVLAGGQGRKQRKQAEAMLKSLKDPGYQIPEEYKTNLAQAEQLARQGMPAEQYNLATTNIQRGTQAGLRQLGRMSNPFAGISGLARTQSDALAGLDAANAAARRQNILGAMGARSELAGQKLAQQQYAQQRYFDQVNQANALMGAGQQNVAGALGSLGQFGLMQSIYGQGGSPSAGTNIPTSTPTKIDYTGGLGEAFAPGASIWNTPRLGGNNLSNLGRSINKVIPRKP